MREREPMTQTMNATAVRQAWSKLLNQVFRRETRVIVEKSGIPVAAIISAEDLERLNRLEEERRRDLAILDESQAAFQDVPPEEVEREIAQAIAQVRAENRRKPKSAQKP